MANQEHFIKLKQSVNSLVLTTVQLGAQGKQLKTIISCNKYVDSKL